MIHPKSQTISDLLNQPYHYAIPRYQRGYAWQEEEVTELVEDLQGSNGPLFLGTMIFDVSDLKKKGKAYVVDGQQRLTSILMLLIACREAARRIRESGIAHQTQNKIAFVDAATGETKGIRLFASESIKDVFQHIADDKWDGRSFPAKIANKGVGWQTRRLKPAYEYLEKELNIQSRDDLTNILKAVYQANIIRIDVEEEEEAFGIFERTNARGVNLTVGDLLKNYLYKENVEDLEGKWGQIIEKSDQSLLRMLKYFYVAQHGAVFKSDLYKKLKIYANKTGSAKAFVDQLLEFAEFYSLVRQADDKKEVQSYFESIKWESISTSDDKLIQVNLCLQALRMFKVTQPVPLLYSALLCMVRTEGHSLKESKSANKFIRLLRVLESYHFINSAVGERPGNKVEKTYTSYAEKFQKTNSFSTTLDALIKDLSVTLISESEFSEKFIQIGYSSLNLPLLAYIFDRVNNASLPTGSWVNMFNPDPTIIRKNYDIEHFFSQQPEKKEQLIGKEALNNIPNLLCLTKQVNGKLGNKTPSEKIALLSTKLKEEIANMPYVGKFVQKYGAQAGLWDKKAVAARASDLAKDAYTRVWKFPS